MGVYVYGADTAGTLQAPPPEIARDGAIRFRAASG